MTVHAPISRETAPRALINLMDPEWSAFADRELLRRHDLGSSFTEIADVLRREPRTIKARYRRLTRVADIRDLLDACGATRAPYPDPGVFDA